MAATEASGWDDPGQASALAGPLGERLAAVGRDLGRHLEALLAALPERPARPSQLMTVLDTNRAVASKLLGALATKDPLELLHRVPGPEPLRRVVAAARALGVGDELVDPARQAVEAFDRAIREEAGTRGALDALIAAARPGARERFEQSNRYAVFKGLSQLRGAQAEHWIGTAVVKPSAQDPTRLDLTWLNGAVAIQRLRPGVSVRFSYRQRRAGEAGVLPPASVVPLDRYCLHPPVGLRAREVGESIQYTLPDELLGPRQVRDLLVVDHHPEAMRRFAQGDPPRRVSLFVEPAVPVTNLLFDVLLHADAFPGAVPELVVFETAYEGLANVNDPERGPDRVEVSETLSALGSGSARLEAVELPRYGEALARLAERFDWDLGQFRGWRLRMAYPVHGWQVCMAFTPPPEP